MVWATRMFGMRFTARKAEYVQRYKHNTPDSSRFARPTPTASRAADRNHWQSTPLTGGARLR